MSDAYDYIVVGAGSAGATVAARLSETGDADVLLLEAGPDYRSAQTPREFQDRNFGLGLEPRPPLGERNPTLVWTSIMARRSPVQPSLPYRRGRGVGGSSTINSLSAIRGVPDDFDGWARDGATGWGFDDILWAYRRLERDLDYPDLPYHGDDGPIPIHREPEAGWGASDHALRETAVAAGHPEHDDSNDPAMTGVGRFATATTREGRRVSTNDAYLEPARERANLVIAGDHHVDRVTFARGIATGVVLADGRHLAVRDGGAVILCAGGVHSPALLMRSGVGPAAALTGLGIEVVADLPVGRGIQDHAMVFAEIPVAERDMISAGYRPCNVVVRYSSGLAGAGDNDMALISTNHNFWGGQATGGILVQLNQVFSRGELTLDGRDCRADPRIELGLLEDERDLVRLQDGVRRARELLARSPFARMAQGPVAAPESAAELRHQVRDVAHICGGARMGDPARAATVVDPECRVLGVDGLRVIDASVMPGVVRGNINLTVIAIAELAAARIVGRAPSPSD